MSTSTISTPDIEDATTSAIAAEVGKRFVLWRTKDISNVSGVGVVATGVLFPTGKIALAWNPLEGVSGTSVAIWDSQEDMMNVHGHNGNTALYWVD